MLTALDNGSYTSPDDPGEPFTHEPRISITDEEGRFLSWLAKNKRVLEIGTGLGVSTQHLLTAKALETCDIDPWVQDNIWPDFAWTNIVFHTDYHSARGPFDVVFVDGLHTKRQARLDAQFAFTVCRGCVVFHDAHIPAVMAGIRDLADWSILNTTHGLATAWSW